MTILAERIIALLKADTTLTTLIGDVKNIFIMNAPLRKDKYIIVSTNVGEDGNNIPMTKGSINVECVTSRTVENAHKICLDIAKRIDVLLNKKENNLSATGYLIISFVRDNSTGLQIDEEANEYFVSIGYNYIVSE